MSFGFGGAAAQSNGGLQAKNAPDLQEIQTEQLGFKALAGDDKLRLLPTPWPANNQPPPSASLLSIASNKGLVAAVGPDVLILASTEGVRRSLREGEGSQIKSFTPQATIPLPGRISQVAFSSDESCLVLAAEQGGLAVYDTNALVNGGKDSAFQIDTKGAAVRQLLPNPNPSNDLAHVFALVLESGQLLMADLKKQALVNTTNGSPVFHENVMCACWSRLGKQVVAGRKDGTAVQIDPQGSVKAEIPIPPRLPELSDSRAQGQPLTSIYWLETNDFLLVHSPVNPTRPPTPEPSYDSNSNMDTVAEPPTDDSRLHIASRENAKSSSWTFQRVGDPAPAAIARGRIPAHHFMQRLKDWPPDLDDMIVTISTISSDIGMMTKSKTPLDSSNPVTSVFTTTAPPDSMRAAMPLSVSEDMDGSIDTSAIGMSMDFSARELVAKPIPDDETMDESPVPLPALYVLNHEGILSIWWILYNASLRQKTPYPDLVAAGGPRPLDPKKEGAAASVQSPATTTPTFASAPPSQIPRPQSSAGPAFGAPSTPGFGGASALGNRSSPWGGAAAPATAAPSAFGKPAFGSSTAIGGGGGFGTVGGMGMNKASVWGAPQTQQSPQTNSAPAFGKPSTPFEGSVGAPSPFAAFGKKDPEQKPASSLFGGGKPMSTFGGVGFGSRENKPSPFTSASQKPTVTAEGSFGSTATLGSANSGSTVGQPSLFGTPSQNSSNSFSFGKPSLPASREETMVDNEPNKPAGEMKESSGIFGGQGFKLGSTFQGDGSANDDLPKPKNAGEGFFGGAFGDVLGEVDKKPEPSTPIKKEPGTEDGPQLKDIPAASTTPASAPKQASDPLTYKAKRFAGDIPPMDIPAEKAKEPDPLEYKPKRFAGDVPPSDIPAERTKEQPDPEPEAPLAGSPPIDLGEEKFSEPAASVDDELPEGPPDEGDEEDWDEEDEGEGEEDEEDEEDDDDEEEEEEEEDGKSQEISDPKALAAFEARFGPKSPKRPEPPEDSTTPATQKKASYTPAGFPKAPIAFPPPTKAQESPRSPSPVRSVTAPLSKPTFGQPSQPFASQSQRIAVPPGKPVQRPSVPAQPMQPEIGDLEDEEDARIQAILNSRPDPTRDLPQFLAHQNYAGIVEKPGIGGQIEKVYRDVNSMIDTLGLNAHALQGFVGGHTQANNDGQRTRTDLDDENGWALDEVDDLLDVQEGLSQVLEDGKLDDVRGKLENLRDEEKEVTRYRAKVAELRKQIAVHSDPTQRAMQHAASLPVETQAQQSELRQGAQRVQKLLSQVEDAMSLLRADLSSLATSNSQANGSAKVPTVEAVTNTILKMTAMIEKKSGDVDVLEAQIKRLPNGIASLNLNADYEDQLVASMNGSKMTNGSPYHTPGRSRTRMLANGDAPGMSGMFGSSRFRTPPSVSVNRQSVLFSPEASMLGRSTGSMSGSARKKMVDVTDEEVADYHVKADRRKKVLTALKKGVESKGVRVIKLE